VVPIASSKVIRSTMVSLPAAMELWKSHEKPHVRFVGVLTRHGWDTAGLWMGFGWAFPADGVVPSSARESFVSRWPARETPCDPWQARPFRISLAFRTGCSQSVVMNTYT